MAGITKTLDPRELVIIYGGLRLVGAGAGEVVSITMSANDFDHVKGTDGEGARILNLDDSATVNVSLLQTSVSNDILSGFRLLDRALPALGVRFLSISDLLGTFRFFSPSAWIEKAPDMTFSNTVETRQWVLKADYVVVHVGGHPFPGV